MVTTTVLSVLLDVKGHSNIAAQKAAKGTQTISCT